MSRILFLSVQPKYAARILDGRKTAELRKVRPNVSKGDTIVLYVSSPEKRVRALATVQEVTSARPDKLWNQVADEAGVTDQEFEEYFGDTAMGYAIYLTDLRALKSPITLSKLRQFWPEFSPPQVYRYLSHEELAKVIGAADSLDHRVRSYCASRIAA